MNAEVYTGKVKNNPTFKPELGVTGSLVSRICRPFEGQNYCVYTDRFYTSVTLAEYLMDQQQTRLVGTAMTNRKCFPKSLITRKMDRGTSKLLFNGKVSAMVWCDKKPIYFVASRYVNEPSQIVLRYNAEQLSAYQLNALLP